MSDAFKLNTATLPGCPLNTATLPACLPTACLPLQGDYFTVEDLAYDYPTLNTL